LKWLAAPAVAFAMLWQSVHAATTVPVALRWKPCSPEKGLLFSGFPEAVPNVWHCRHPASVFTPMVPVCQLGAVTAPWQLTFAQVSAVLSKEAAPAFALYAVRNAASPGGTRSESLPATALARL